MLTADYLYNSLGIPHEGNGNNHYHIDYLREGLTGRDCNTSGVYMIVLPNKLMSQMKLYVRKEDVKKMVRTIFPQKFGIKINETQLNDISNIIQSEYNNSTNFDKTDILFIGKSANLKVMIQFLNVFKMSRMDGFKDGQLIKLIPDWKDLMVYWYKTDRADYYKRELMRGFKRELNNMTPFANVDY